MQSASQRPVTNVTILAFESLLVIAANKQHLHRPATVRCPFVSGSTVSTVHPASGMETVNT